MSPFHFSLSPWGPHASVLEAIWQLTSSPSLGEGGGLCVAAWQASWDPRDGGHQVLWGSQTAGGVLGVGEFRKRTHHCGSHLGIAGPHESAQIPPAGYVQSCTSRWPLPPRSSPSTIHSGISALLLRACGSGDSTVSGWMAVVSRRDLLAQPSGRGMPSKQSESQYLGSRGIAV